MRRNRRDLSGDRGTGDALFFPDQPINFLTIQLYTGEMSELAEGARLEIVCAVNSGTEGSNPSLSAIKSLRDLLTTRLRCLTVSEC